MSTTATRIPPGPPEPFDETRDLLDWMRVQIQRYGDIFKSTAYGTTIYVINDIEFVQHVLRKNWRNYRKGLAIKRVGLLLGNGLMVSEGQLWKTQRKLVQSAFHRTAITEFVRVVRAANDELIGQWELAARNNQNTNITSDLSQMVLKSVLLAIFGDDYSQVAPRFRLLADDAVRDLRFAQEFRSLKNIVADIVDDRRRQCITAPDLLGLLMETRDAGSGQAMSRGQLTSEVMTLVVAGHETTASTLNLMWYLLSQNPDVLERLGTELAELPEGGCPTVDDLTRHSYGRQVIEESLRLYPAGWLMTRRALKDDLFGDYFVPAGTEIYISPYFIQRHPALWEDPDRFDPDRFSPERSRDRPELAMLPFSAGPRNCIGEMFARIEMQIHLMTAAKRLRLHYAGTQPPELDIGVNMRGKHDFIMTPELRV